jgi:GNAT superfamily N-acetyltransferase
LGRRGRFEERNVESIETLIAGEEHLARVKALFREIDLESGTIGPGEQAQTDAGMEASRTRHDFLASGSFWLILGKAGSEFAGYLTAVRIPKADSRIGVLYLDEMHVLARFRRRGVGSALVKRARKIATEIGLWRLRLNADPEDTGVMSFYKSLGFSRRKAGLMQSEVLGG